MSVSVCACVYMYTVCMCVHVLYMYMYSIRYTQDIVQITCKVATTDDTTCSQSHDTI